ncbi:hypothetical protein CKA32_000124 [Geitlerinema sp. FC II]|nr:hypothetical protein CKA32_000124 [Geitlerinema sp. FC II]
MHQMFQSLIEEYHPFASYVGYDELEDGFILYYQGVGEVQGMVIDTDGNIVADSTVGTTRSMGLLAVGTTILSALMGTPQNN